MKKVDPKSAEKKLRRTRIMQSSIPKYKLEECIELAKCLNDELNGDAAPHELAVAFQISPTSSAWQKITGACVAYGLTEGAYNSDRIHLSSLGRRILTPTEEGDDALAKVEAALHPIIIKEFYEKYDKGKFPTDRIALNVLESMGVPKVRLNEVLTIIKNAGSIAGLLHETKTGLYVAIGPPTATKREPHVDKQQKEGLPSLGLPSAEGEEKPPALPQRPAKDSVFISHGKNKNIVEQLKELLKFGKFTPVVAIEHETTSKPVPEKVMDDMRKCFAGVIHVESEQQLLDEKGTKHHKINENVLIEIGAAMALYGKNFILLVQKGIHLPSNLQGLYRCEYEGDMLDYDATMKLLKAFNEFK